MGAKKEVTTTMDKEKFGMWLNERRTQKGMTQEELANELNYTKQAVSKWELGKGMFHS